MNNKILKNVLKGVSTLIGFIVAENIYRTSIHVIKNREMIGDAEVISEETIEES